MRGVLWGAGFLVVATGVGVADWHGEGARAVARGVGTFAAVAIEAAAPPSGSLLLPSTGGAAAIQSPRLALSIYPEAIGKASDRLVIPRHMRVTADEASPVSREIRVAEAGDAGEGVKRSDIGPRSAAEAPRQRLTRSIQTELVRVGCYRGPVDGDWSNETRKAMQAFNERVNASLPITQPDYILLTLLQGHAAKACGGPCPPGQALADNGGCLPRSVIMAAKRETTGGPPQGAALSPAPNEHEQRDGSRHVAATARVDKDAELIAQRKATAEKAIAEAERARRDAEALALRNAAAEQAKVDAERARLLAEQTRARAEQERADRERQRVAAANKAHAEVDRARGEAEAAKLRADQERAERERQRIAAADRAQTEMEAARRQAVEARQRAEQERTQRERQRLVAAELARLESEKARNQAEDAKLRATEERAERNRQQVAAAEAARMEAEKIRKQAEETRRQSKLEHEERERQRIFVAEERKRVVAAEAVARAEAERLAKVAEADRARAAAELNRSEQPPAVDARQARPLVSIPIAPAPARTSAPEQEPPNKANFKAPGTPDSKIATPSRYYEEPSGNSAALRTRTTPVRRPPEARYVGRFVPPPPYRVGRLLPPSAPLTAGRTSRSTAARSGERMNVQAIFRYVERHSP